MVNGIKIVGGTVGGFLAYWLGGLDAILICLIAMIVLDYITGVLAAVYNGTVSSEIGWKGIVKKVITMLVVALAFIIETATGNTFAIREIVIMFFIVNEAISMLENVTATGIKIPDKLKSILEQIKQEKGE